MARRPVTDPAPPTPADQIQWNEVQRLVRSGFGAFQVARFLVGTVVDRDAAAAWLSTIAPIVAYGPPPPDGAGPDDGFDAAVAGGGPDREGTVQVALTAAGLLALGVEQGELRTMSRPFVEGMCTPHRQRILGDRGESAPGRWIWGGPGGPEPHVLLLSYAKEGDADDHAMFATGSGIAEVFDETTILPTSKREPFGFVDGIARLLLAKTPAAEDASDPIKRYSVVQPGEVVLGAVDEGEVAPPEPAPLARNGSYLVVRQLRQHVDRFHAYLHQASVGDDDLARQIAAKMVGRHQDGTPLVASPAGPDDDSFGFAGVDGTICPLGAHIRRANPRDDDRTTLESSKRHRILRRGRPYGVDADGEPTKPDGRRGLLFAALNADLERQFEFIQHNWLNNQTFDRNGEVDPLSGTQLGTGQTFTYAFPDDTVRRRLRDLPEFVTVEGGAYFLLPSRTALAAIVATATSSTSSTSGAAGAQPPGIDSL
jgi:Dyp-type peroxidase family